MNAGVKKTFIWISGTIFLLVGIRFVLGMFGFFNGHRVHQEIHYIRGGGGPGPGFEHHQEIMMISGLHHGHDFGWIGMILFLLAVFIIGRFLFKKLQKTNKNNSFNQFVGESSLPSVNTPTNRQNAELLDNWERSININSNKENE